ncbi:MAG TPA: hypothetical protein VLH13_01085 [Methanomassiliicoccales archaeon]|nr:hypothetical protein [Methanomassiliicoccales archaeon]
MTFKRPTPIPTGHPLSASSSREFSELYFKKYGRRPDAACQNIFWKQRPEIFEQENGVSLARANARIRRD